MKCAHRGVESRFERWGNPGSNLAAASWDEGAPSALKTNAAGDFLSANGAAFNKCAHRGIESRFQRLPVSGFEFWGVAPGWDEGALSALKTNAAGNFLSVSGAALNDSLGQLSAEKANAAGNFLSANGAAFNDSLGQRPRIAGTVRSIALKARFTSIEASPTGRQLRKK
jgi:hypothetical protein